MAVKLVDKTNLQNQALKLRIHPTIKQEILINKTFGCVRKVYNDRIAEKQALYENIIKPEENTQNCKELWKTTHYSSEKELKEQFPYLKEASAQALCSATLNAEIAYSNFLNSFTGKRKGKKVGKPKFKMRMINTFAPLIIPSFVGSALYIFMIRQFLFTIPREISDAGFIDGANEFQIFIRLILPLMQPAVAVVAIFTALASWNDFMGPLIYIQNEELYPLSIGLQFFRTQREVQYSMLMAASALVALPVVVIFLCFQRFFVEGITIGALKG